MRCTVLSISVAWSCLAVTTSGYDEPQHVLGGTASSVDNVATLRLREIHHVGSHRYPGLHLLMAVDNMTATSSAHGLGTGPFDIKIHPSPMTRLTDHSPSAISAFLSQPQSNTNPPSWTTDSTLTPNISDKQTILSFARMSANAYYEGVNRTGWKWKDISAGYNYTLDFGWEEDGLRGHVFVDGTNSSLVVALKGTSVPWLDEPTTTHRDLLNDNLLGSCCCGRGGPFFWKPVCDCTVSPSSSLSSSSSHQTCNTTCLQHELHNTSAYYAAARKIFTAVQLQYPHAEIWLTGHSLGGVVASLLGHTYGAPTLTFETFPEALAASRLGLPTPPGHRVGHTSLSQDHVFHFGNTGDPIFMAQCRGSLSPCSLWGYAFESACHTGRRCVYDTVGKLGWWIEVRNHGIERVIKNVLEEWDGVPECEVVRDCRDCEGWEFVD